MKETLRQERAKVMVKTIEPKTMRFRAGKFKEELSIARTNVSLQTFLREEAREQLDAKA